LFKKQNRDFLNPEIAERLLLLNEVISMIGQSLNKNNDHGLRAVLESEELKQFGDFLWHAFNELELHLRMRNIENRELRLEQQPCINLVQSESP
jgi:hypothetical protein